VNDRPRVSDGLRHLLALAVFIEFVVVVCAWMWLNGTPA